MNRRAGRIALLASAAMVWAATAMAQDAPLRRPADPADVAPAATRPPQRPETGPAEDPAISETGPSEPAPEAAEGQPAGRLIPPEETTAEDPAVDRGDDIRPESGQSNAQKANAEQTQAPPTGPAMPEVLREDDMEWSSCLLALSILGVGYEEGEALTDGEARDCGIARPVTVTSLSPGIAIEGGAVMRCASARSLALWTRDAVLPAAAALPGAPRLTAMRPGSTYQCRGRVGTGDPEPKLSEHAFGSAIDIASFVFDSGLEMVVKPPEDGADMSGAFLRAVQGAACLHFTTVLGPGSNAAHDNHLHMDMAPRRGGWRLCQ